MTLDSSRPLIPGVPAARKVLKAPVLTLLLLAGLAAACNKAGNALTPLHPALAAADGNRERLIGQVVVPSLDRTLATADALRGDGILPFGGAELRQMLLARLKLEPQLLELIDTNQPIALAFVAPAAPTPAAAPGAPSDAEADAYVAGAVTIRSLEAAVKVVAALGTAAETRKEAQRFARPGGETMWIARVGTQVVWSDTFEGLSEAGAHAVAARQARQENPAAVGDDVIATLFPPAISRQENALALKKRAMSAYEGSLRDGGKGEPAASERASVDAGLDFFLVPMAETDRLRVGFGLSAERGLGVRWHATPRPGSAFAQRLATRASYQLPAGVKSRTDLVTVLSLGALPAWPALAQAIIDKQSAAGVPGAAAVAARLRALLPLLSGSLYEGTRVQGDSLGLDLIVGLGPKAVPSAAIDALAALASDPGFALLLQQIWRTPPRIESKRKDTRLEVTFAFPDSDRPGSPAAMARAFSGTSNFSLIAQAVPGRLLLSTEPGAAERLRTLAAAPFNASGTGEEAGPIGAAARETAGREGLLYFDLWGFARPVLRASLAGNQRRFMDMMLAIPGLSTMSLPLWLSLDGGDAFVAELRVPQGTLKNASMLMNLIGGGGAIGGLAPSP